MPGNILSHTGNCIFIDLIEIFFKMKPDQERVRALLTDTVTLLCKNGLHFDKQMRVQGLLGITLDDDDVFIVHINESVVDNNSLLEQLSSDIPKTRPKNDRHNKKLSAEAETRPSPVSVLRTPLTESVSLPSPSGLDLDLEATVKDSAENQDQLLPLKPHETEDSTSVMVIKAEPNEDSGDVLIVSLEAPFNLPNSVKTKTKGDRLLQVGNTDMESLPVLNTSVVNANVSDRPRANLFSSRVMKCYRDRSHHSVRPTFKMDQFESPSTSQAVQDFGEDQGGNQSLDTKFDIDESWDESDMSAAAAYLPTEGYSTNSNPGFSASAWDLGPAHMDTNEFVQNSISTTLHKPVSILTYKRTRGLAEYR